MIVSVTMFSTFPLQHINTRQSHSSLTPRMFSNKYTTSLSCHQVSHLSTCLDGSADRGYDELKDNVRNEMRLNNSMQVTEKTKNIQNFQLCHILCSFHRKRMCFRWSWEICWKRVVRRRGWRVPIWRRWAREWRRSTPAVCPCQCCSNTNTWGELLVSCLSKPLLKPSICVSDLRGFCIVLQVDCNAGVLRLDDLLESAASLCDWPSLQMHASHVSLENLVTVHCSYYILHESNYRKQRLIT